MSTWIADIPDLTQVAPLEDDLRLAVIAGRLSVAFERSGLSMRELSSLTGLSRYTITRYLRGQRIPSGDALVRLCPVLGISATWLLGLDERTQRALERELHRRRPAHTQSASD